MSSTLLRANLTFVPVCASAVLGALGLLTTAAAAGELVQLEETIVVTATRLGQTARETGSSVSLITAEDIESSGFNFVVDAIAAAPGVTVNQNGTFGGVATVRLRGASSEQTLVLIDGIAVNDTTSPGGGFDFARLDAANVERVEILKGPQSTLWGSDAIGGVVSITTTSAADKLGGKLFLEYGAFSTFRGGASISGGNEIGDFRVSVNAIDSKGLSKADSANGNSEKDGFQSGTVAARGGLNLPRDARLNVSLLLNESDNEFDSFAFGSEGNVGDGDERSKTEELAGQVSLAVPLLDGRFRNLLVVGYSDLERNNFTNGVAGFSAEGSRDTYRYQGNININDRHNIAFGAERENNDNGTDTSTIDGIFGLYELELIDGLSLTAGIRSDDVEDYGSETTARFAASYNPNDQVTLRGSWGEGFKAPTIFQTTFFCCGASAPNPDLQPETSDAFDVGVEWRTEDGRGDIGVTYFSQVTTNLILFSFGIGGYENIAEADSQGIELTAAYQLTEWLGVSANYSWIDATDKTSGNRLVRVPRHSGDLAFALDNGGPWSANVLVRHNGEEVDGNGNVDDWTRVDLAGRYAPTDRLEFYARIENLFDENYQQILGFGTPGLSASAGVRLQF